MHDTQKPKHPYLQQSEVPRQCFSNSVCPLAEPSHDSTWLDQDTSDASRSMKGHRGDYRCTTFCPHLLCSIWYVRTICTVPCNRACNALPACDLTSKTWPTTHLKGCVVSHLLLETLHSAKASISSHVRKAKLALKTHCIVGRIPSTAALARLPSLVQPRGGVKKPVPKHSGGVLAFLHRLRMPNRAGLNKVANSAPSSSRGSHAEARTAWQALQEDSSSEDHKVRSGWCYHAKVSKSRLSLVAAERKSCHCRCVFKPGPKHLCLMPVVLSVLLCSRLQECVCHAMKCIIAYILQTV